MNIRIYLALFPACFSVFSAMAQPVLGFDVEPKLGNTMNYLGTNILPLTDPGPSGPNQVWTLPPAPAPFPNQIRVCVAPSETPFAAQFPGTQYCVKTLITGSPTAFSYYSQTDSSARYHGLAFLGNIVYKNNPAWEQIYPMTYGMIKTGQFNGTKKVGTQITYFHTNFEQQYDGYGSLGFGGGILYNNVIRVKTLHTRIDSLPAANGSHTRTIVNETFFKWFVEGIPGYLALVSQVDAVQMNISVNGDTSQLQQFPTQYSNEWQSSFSVDTEETDSEETTFFTLAGNPVQDWLTILCNDHLNQPAEVFIADLSGKILFSTKTLGNEDKMVVPVAGYSAGMYLLTIQSAVGRQTRIWIKS